LIITKACNNSVGPVVLEEASGQPGNLSPSRINVPPSNPLFVPIQETGACWFIRSPARFPRQGSAEFSSIANPLLRSPLIARTRDKVVVPHPTRKMAIANTHPPPAPPHQLQQAPPQHTPSAQQRPTQRPGPRKSRAFSFRSDKSRGSGSNHKIDLHETSAEKEAKRLHSKADPTLAMQEAEPCEQKRPNLHSAPLLT